MFKNNFLNYIVVLVLFVCFLGVFFYFRFICFCYFFVVCFLLFVAVFGGFCFYLFGGWGGGVEVFFVV